MGGERIAAGAAPRRSDGRKRLNNARRAFRRMNTFVDHCIVDLPNRLVAIWIILNRHADGDGWTFVSAETVRRKLGLKSVRPVKAAFQELRELGFLSKATRRPGRGHRQWRRVMLPKRVAVPAANARGAETIADSVGPEHSPGDEGGHSNSTVNNPPRNSGPAPDYIGEGSDGDHQAAVNCWQGQYRGRYGHDYPLQPRDHAILRDVRAAVRNAGTLAGVFTRYLACSREYFHGHPLAKLLSELPQFLSDRRGAWNPARFVPDDLHNAVL